MNYRNNLRTYFFPFMQSRLAPFIGVSLTFSLVAHKSFDGLGSFAYVLAIFAMISAPLSLPLSAVGNIATRRRRDEGDMPMLFNQGMSFTLVLVAISVVLGIGIVSGLPFLAGSRTLDRNALVFLAIVYVPALPLLILNSYLHFYHESCGQAQACARIKSVCVVLACLYLCGAFTIVRAEDYPKFAIGYFFIVEALQFVSFYWLSRKAELTFSIVACGDVARQILRLGVPMSLGLCSQKIFYYLLNERLAAIHGGLVADLSIYMCIMGISVIPVTAFSQLHSIHVSRAAQHPMIEYRTGLRWCCALIAMLTLLLAILGKILFFIFGGDTALFTARAFTTMSLYLMSGSLFAVSSSQLRAMSDTFTPQITINILMLCFLLPMLYFFDMGGADIDTFLRYQSVFVLLGFMVLQGRIWTICRKEIRVSARME